MNSGLISVFTRYINFKMGLAGAVVMGSIIFAINYDFGWSGAGIAAAKQGLYTFFFGGMVVRLCETISLSFRSKSISVLLACLIPTIVATIAVFSVHSIKGTPLPMESTLPTLILSVPGFLAIGLRKRNTSLEKS